MEKASRSFVKNLGILLAGAVSFLPNVSKGYTGGEVAGLYVDGQKVYSVFDKAVNAVRADTNLVYRVGENTNFVDRVITNTPAYTDVARSNFVNAIDLAVSNLNGRISTPLNYSSITNVAHKKIVPNGRVRKNKQLDIVRVKDNYLPVAPVIDIDSATMGASRGYTNDVSAGVPGVIAPAVVSNTVPSIVPTDVTDSTRVPLVAPILSLDNKVSRPRWKYYGYSLKTGSVNLREGMNNAGHKYNEAVKDLTYGLSLGFVKNSRIDNAGFWPVKQAVYSFGQVGVNLGKTAYNFLDMFPFFGALPNLHDDLQDRNTVKRVLATSARTFNSLISGTTYALGPFRPPVVGAIELKNDLLEGTKHPIEGGFGSLGIRVLHPGLEFITNVAEGEGSLNLGSGMIDYMEEEKGRTMPYLEWGAQGALMGWGINNALDNGARGGNGSNGGGNGGNGVLGGGRVGGAGGR
ncbi:MAG: hypothetical protein AABX11_03090 [Nanoarchaeota archaeon]